MATIYAEAVLVQETKITDANGEIHGGPVYYIKKAYNGKFGKILAGFFAVSIILALGFIGAMQLAVGEHFGAGTGNILIAICLMFFAFTTIIGWNFFAKINIQYLFKNNKIATVVFSIISICFIFLGSCINKVNLVWELADMFNNLMVIPNFLGLIPLGAIVAVSAKNAKKESKLK